ncbi:MAG TPA: hypothetical protein VMG12_36040 [Polyangiaceae bacterium]|nr:hypothetical protein [Polyangiaceae bacterium]
MNAARAAALALSSLALSSLGCGAADDGDVAGGAGNQGVAADVLAAHAAALDACIDDNPPAEPFDLGDTDDVRGDPVPQPGVDPIPRPPFTAADIAQVCRDGNGSGCDERLFISRAAADCIARESELAAGVAPWSTTLEFFAPYDRVCWNILSVLEYTEDGFRAELLVLDATSGEELARRSDRYESPEY